MLFVDQPNQGLPEGLPTASHATSSTAQGPQYSRIAAACARWGLSRSGIYRLAAEGHIRLVKLGGSTLVDCDSVREFMASLPAASVRARRATNPQ
jgi:excisionase family DNA binding protein